MNGKGQTVRLWSPTIPNSRNYVPSNYYIWPARFSRPISRMERILRRIAVSISLFRFDKRYVEYTHWEKHGFDFPCNSNFFPFCSLSCSLFVCLCLLSSLVWNDRWSWIFLQPFFSFPFSPFSSPSSNKFRWNQPLQWSKFRRKKCDKFVEGIKISSMQSDRHSFLERPRLELTGASHGRNHEFWKRLSFYPLNPR